MDLYSLIKSSIISTGAKLNANTLDGLLWLVNIVPSFAGFSIQNDKIAAPFWILHLSMLFYVYGVGSLVYQWKYAEGAGDFIKSYFNISILILTANNSWWFLMKRPSLKCVLKLIRENDMTARSTPVLQAKHERLMKITKRVILIFYFCNCVNAALVYLPHRVDTSNQYSMQPCVGMEPLTSSPNREICLTMLCLQEFTIMTVVLNYQALLLLLIAHNTAMYQIMADEMMSLNDDNIEVKEKLTNLIGRHSLTLDIIDKLKLLYSVPLGVNFGSNAVCISLFFFLPLDEWLQFMPIMVYCFLVFFLYCFLCQRLINASEEFESSVYCCGWEKFGLKEKKLIYLMIRQAQKPVELLAADIIPVNIYTFATTLQAMYKFVTVVKV